MLNKMGTSAGADRPDVSLVVASFSGREMLEQCLKSIAVQEGSPEVIVVTNSSALATSELKKRFAEFQFIHEPRDTDVFQLRTKGALKARGQMVAFIEDHCIAEPGWLSALRRAYREKEGRIIGGSVDYGGGDYGGNGGLYGWSLFLCEYARYMPSQSDAAAATLSGVNVAYDREILQSCHETWRTAMYENELHDAFCRAGHQLRFVNEARVRTHLKMSLGQSMVHLFTGGLRFGWYRQSRSTPLRRFFWIATATAIPFVLTQRIVRHVAIRQPKRLAHLVGSMPFLVLLLTAWSLGEAVGLFRAIVGTRVEQPAKGDCNANWC